VFDEGVEEGTDADGVREDGDELRSLLSIDIISFDSLELLREIF
tara:strand:+ start:362 stop:493 length:132 start_codon:yes stop_codon:yes gene_type:complete